MNHKFLPEKPMFDSKVYIEICKHCDLERLRFANDSFLPAEWGYKYDRKWRITIIDPMPETCEEAIIAQVLR